ncbi:MAG: FimB/Mfa2 family fimbrial subunit [Prevotella sp.]|nr:FimB/Mfa2 family fimbrial subunit [Prevotella sp.]
MKRMLILASVCLLALFAFTSCEKPSMSEATEEEESGGVVNGDIQVRFRIAQIEQVPFEDATEGTRSTPISELCQRISFGVYQNGKMLKTVHEQVGDEHFGQVTLSLAAGSYQVVIVAHNGEENAQINNPEAVTFKESNHLKVTDTFYYYDTIEVTEDCSVDVKMKRAVAMVKFMMKDTIPAGVEKLRFYYTGGSSTLDATTGKGCVSSKQTEFRDVTEEMIGKPGVFYFYTFPHETEGKLKLTITAYNKNSNIVQEKSFENVPVTRNQITQYTGYFFTDDPGDEPSDTISGGNEANGNAAFLLMTDDEWNLKELTF